MRAALVDTVGEPNIFTIGTGVLRSHESVFASLLVDLVIPGVEVEGVVAIDVSINGVAGIGSEEGRGEVVAQTQSVNSLTHTVEVVVLRQLGNELDELVLVDQNASSCVIQDITSRLTDDGEGEARVIAPAELQINVFSLGFGHALLWQVDKIW